MKRILCCVHNCTRRRLIALLVNSLLVVNAVCRPPVRVHWVGDVPRHPYKHPILLPALLVIVMLLLPGPPSYGLLLLIAIWSIYHCARFLRQWNRNEGAGP